MAAFEFAGPGRIAFGAGVAARLAAEAQALGTRALVVTGASPGRHAEVLEPLRAAGLQAAELRAVGEPTVATADAAACEARLLGLDLVIAVGGGAALDLGKAVAALVPNGGEAMDYLEVFGRGQALGRASLPLIAVPTTAGPGSEATRNAVLRAEEQGVKASLRSATMLPRLALVDPRLTLGLPPAATAATGLDALTQLIEPLTSARANPLTDALAREGLARVARSLRRACRDGSDLEARTDLSLASLFGGLCLANAGLGVIHGIAGPLGGAFPVPHGVACARLLPLGMAANLAALATRAPQHPARECYAEIARLLTGSDAAAAEDGVAWIAGLVEDLGIPRLGALGVTAADVQALAAAAVAASSMRANPIALAGDEVAGIIAAAL